ncbi:MAG: DUF1648 domain-containing protein [Micropepsaceae bacterium]
MTQQDPFVVMGATFVAMLAISLIAYLIFPKDARVPMQWGLTGQPTWTAPKAAAVLFVPVLTLAAMSLAIIPLFADSEHQRLVSALPSIAMLFLLIHILHLCLAQWHFNASNR